MKVFITGNKGQLGKSLELTFSHHELAFGDLPEWDMTDYEQVLRTIKDFGPDVIIHAAALTQVDYCAEHPEEAVRVNGYGTYNVALAARKVGAVVVEISSNEVFDGKENRPYQEYDQRNPINPYGYSKLVAEKVIERFVPDYMIVRTAWLFSPGGNNFIHKIIDRAKQGGSIQVVTDEIGSPTYALDLAEALGRILEIGRPGIYHMVNEGVFSRFDFARLILDVAGYHDIPITPITSDTYSRLSTPPAYSPLANHFGAAMGVRMRPLEEALRKFISEA